MLKRQKLKLFRQRKIKDNLKLFRRTIRTSIKSPSLALDYINFRRIASVHDWKTAESMIDKIAFGATKAGDSRLVKEMAEASLRFNNLGAYTHWQVESERLDGNFRNTDWVGEDLSDAMLWISFRETKKQGMVAGLNLTGYVNDVAKQAKCTVLVVEDRLVPIFARTLPDIEVISGPATAVAKQDTRLVTANSLILRSIMGVEQEIIDSLYIPLVPSYKIVSDFRLKYANDSNLPIFGIAWGTFSVTKSEAPLEFWIDLVKSIDAIFVVTQYKYDGFDNDLDKIINAAPERIIFDNTVDQLVDMDSFAAQLSSLDALISTSSSDTHFSGALGVPTFMVCDDLFRRACPVKSYNRIPWYPDSTLYGKSGREWSVVFRDLKNGLIKKYGQTILINQM